MTVVIITDRSFQMQAPRHTYLPVLLPEIRDNLVRLARDEQDMAELTEDDWWFEYAAEQSQLQDEGEQEVLQDTPEPTAVRGTGEACRW